MKRNSSKPHALKSPEMVDRFSGRVGHRLMAIGIVIGSLTASTAEVEAREEPLAPIEIPAGESVFQQLRTPAGTITDFYLPAGLVTLTNITATESAGPGYIQALPAVIGETSNVNTSRAEQTIASAAFIQPDNQGKAGIYNQVAAHVIVDRQGSFREGVVDIVDPNRMYDSRETGILVPGSKTVIGGFKENSTAIVNITTTETLIDGYIQGMTTLDGPVGAYSNANASVGRNTAKLATLRTNQNGEIVLFSSGRTHVAVDLQGYMNGVDDIVDVRAVDTREDGPMLIPAGTVLEVPGRPNSVGIVSVLSLNARREGFIQALPVNNPVIGSASNLNAEPGQVVGQLVFLEFDDNGIGRIFFQDAGEAVVDIQAYLTPGDYIPSQERILDTRDGTQNRPVNPVCEKVALAVGATATGTIEGARYEIKVINPDATFTSYNVPDLSFATAGKNYAIDPATCDSPSGPSLLYAVGEYPGAELYRRNLLTGVVAKVPTIIGKFERPDPQPEGLFALQTENGLGGRYLGNVLDIVTGERLYNGSVKDFSVSDNGTTRVSLETYYAGFFGGDNKTYDAINIQKYNPITKRFEFGYFQVESLDINNSIFDIETSPGGETIAVMRYNGSPTPEIAVLRIESSPITLAKVNLPAMYQPIAFKLVDFDTAITSVIENGPSGPTLKILSVDVSTGSFNVINTGPAGNIISVAL